MKGEGIPRFHERLLGRILVFVALPLTGFLILVITLNARRSFVQLRAAAERDLRSAAALSAQQIEDRNNNAANAARMLADAQSDGLFGDRRAVLRLMEHLVLAAPRFNGLFCVYEPDADGQDGANRDALPAGSITETGRFAPYVYRLEPGGTRLDTEPNVDMEISPYYQGVKDAFAIGGRPETMVTEPYIYRGTGKMLVEFSHPIIIDERFAGVAGVDLILTDVERELRKLAERSGTDAFLISSRGNFIAATVESRDTAQAEPEANLKTRRISEVDDGPVLEQLRQRREDVSLALEDVGADGARYYFAAARILTGEWTLVLRQSEQAVLAPIWAQTRKTVGLAAIALVIVLSALIGTSVRVVRRVRTAAEAAHRVARGDLTVRIDPGSCRDETGLLLRAIKSMTENLNSLVGHTQRASVQLNSTASELAATSREQEETVSSFGAATAEIAVAATQISATGGELAGTMNEVRCVAEETAELATAGQTSLKGMQSAMHSLGDGTKSIAAKLATINEKANDITSVVTTIIKVADQTNLLSVNAAIEAEKAGGVGVGFLVVAREIRQLADQTAAATLDIEETIRQMQSAVSEGVMEMDRFAEHVRVSVKNVADVAHQMEQIIERVRANTESFGRVNEGMHTQSQGADQIRDAMGQLTTSAKRTSAAIDEYARAAAALQSAISTLRTSVTSFRLDSAGAP